MKQAIGTRVITLDDETFTALRNANWGEIGKALLAVAINYSQKYPSIGYQTCDDIVQDVVFKTLSGDRNWDPRRGELLPWLKWCVKSELDNSAKKLATAKELPLFDPDDDSVDIAANQHPQTVTASTNPGSTGRSGPEHAILNQEREEKAKQTIASVYDAVSHDEELEELVLAMDCLLDDHESAQKPSRRELAEYLDVSEDDINNRMKRLRRCLLKVGINK